MKLGELGGHTGHVDAFREEAFSFVCVCVSSVFSLWVREGRQEAWEGSVQYCMGNKVITCPSQEK